MPSDIVLDPAVEPHLLPAMLPPAKSALLLIDVQKDFVSAEGAVGHWGIDLSVLDQPLANIEKIIAAAKSAGVITIYIRVITRPETDSTALLNLHVRKGRPPQAVAICRAGTPGADYHRIAPAEGDWEIEKPLYSSFVGTNLDEKLRAHNIENLVITGFTSDCCVDCTARDAFHRNYNVFLVQDACAAYEQTLHLGAMDALSKNCALLTNTESLLAAWH